MTRSMVDISRALAGFPLIAMITEPDAPAVPDVVAALGAAGVPAVEITLTTAGAFETVRRSAAIGATLVGAGTVLTPQTARRAVDAGADYLLTPGVLPEVVDESRQLGVPVVCGAFTPTEVLAAWQRGASMVKLFPAWMCGPQYVASIHMGMPDIPLVPTGGVGRDQVADYLAAGATAVALGREIVGDALRGGDLSAISDRVAGLKALAEDAIRGRR